jgi:hypothetical protein
MLSQIAKVQELCPLVIDESLTRRCGSLTGSDRSIKLLTSDKIAVLAPIPKARDSAATTETTGVACSARTAIRTSFIRRLPVSVD